MAKLTCICGHIIVDQEINIPYKGYILPDKLLFDTLNKLTENIDEMLEAIKSGQRDEWIKKKFNIPPYPMGERESTMIYDLFIDHLSSVQQDMYECEKCGRIAIEIGQSERFRFFSPDNPETKGLLDPENNEV